MKDRLILALLAGAFLMLALDVRHMHHGVLQENRFSWIPILYAVAAAVACLAGMGLTGKGRVVLAVIMGLGPLVGGAGAWFHYQDSPGSLALTVRQGLPGGDRLMKEPDEDDYPSPGAPPLVAPLSFIGLSLIGLVVLSMDQPKPARKKSK